MRTKLSLVLLLIVIIATASDVTAQGDAAGTTWQATYWNNVALSGDPVLERTESSLDHQWGFGSPGHGISADRFSARWRTSIQLAAGRYRFTATVDDGIRVYVDGRLVISSWRVQSPRTFTEEIDLEGGPTPIVVEYFENTGMATARFSWEAVQITADSWYGAYYDNRNLTGQPVLVRQDKTIRFNWGESSPAPDRLDPDTFSARWQRMLNLAPGNYRFRVTVDDGARLWVDNQLLIDRWVAQPETTYVAEANVDGGPVPVRLEYFENGGLAQVSLNWERVPASPPPPAATSTPQPPATGTVIVDNGTAQFVSGGRPAGDLVEDTGGFGGNFLWTENGSRLPTPYNWAQWRPKLRAGRYEVSVFIPHNHASTTQARYYVIHGGESSLRLVNQQAHGGEWVSLGTFDFDGQEDYLSLADVTFEESGTTFVAFDAARWQPSTISNVGSPVVSVAAQRISPGTRVIVYGSGFTPRADVRLLLGLPGEEARGEYAEGRIGADGTVRLSFVMPSTWPDGTSVLATVPTSGDIALALTDDTGIAAFAFVNVVPSP